MQKSSHENLSMHLDLSSHPGLLQPMKGREQTKAEVSSIFSHLSQEARKPCARRGRDITLFSLSGALWKASFCFNLDRSFPIPIIFYDGIRRRAQFDKCFFWDTIPPLLPLWKEIPLGLGCVFFFFSGLQAPQDSKGWPLRNIHQVFASLSTTGILFLLAMISWKTYTKIQW